MDDTDVHHHIPVITQYAFVLNVKFDQYLDMKSGVKAGAQDDSVVVYSRIILEGNQDT